MRHPFCISITGADDLVDPAELVRLSRSYPFVEWAVLYFPERCGHLRCPSDAWRANLAALRQDCGLRTALHLCGTEVFREVLEHGVRPALAAELAAYDRIQLNVSAGPNRFSSAEVRAVYTSFAAAGVALILQRHADTAELVDMFITEHPAAFHAGELAVLFDASRGRGVAPARWPAPLSVIGLGGSCGYAGGLGPDNIETAVVDVAEVVAQSPIPRTRFWFDMETGVRTDDLFDLAKVEMVLAAVADTLPARPEMVRCAQ